MLVSIAAHARTFCSELQGQIALERVIFGVILRVWPCLDTLLPPSTRKTLSLKAFVPGGGSLHRFAFRMGHVTRLIWSPSELPVGIRFRN